MLYTFPERDPHNRIIKLPDPTDKGSWPKAPSRFVFIFEAINLAGSALFGDKWTGNELAVVKWGESPQAQIERLRQAPPIGGGATGSYDSYSTRTQRRLPPLAHVYEYWARKRQPLFEENNRATERLLDCVDWLAQHCRDGELKSFARLLDGGSLMEMRAEEWNIDQPLSAFVVQGGGLRRCYELGMRSGPFQTLAFFDRQELLEALKREPDAPLIVGEADLSRLSPYLRLAVRVALEQGYFSKDECETREVREAEVRAAWPDLISAIEAVPAMVGAIAKVINFPDANAVKQGQSGGKARKTGGTQKP